MIRHVLAVYAVLVCAGLGVMGWSLNAGATPIDLSAATIVPTPADGVVMRAAEMLRDEVARRGGATLAVGDAPASGPRIVIGAVSEMPSDRVPAKAEGYAIWCEQTGPGPVVHLVGRDELGALFAAGRLVRELTYEGSGLRLDSDIAIATAPDTPVRVHQLGFRNTANTYDAWDLATYEQYIRDLVLFGANGIELIPHIDPDLVDGPVMKPTVWDMNAALTELVASYGLQVWLWSSVEDDVSTPEGAAAGAAARKAMLESCARVDALFVPGGDDGSTPAEILMPWLADVAKVLKETHPNATLWVSNQTFTFVENEYFFSFLHDEDPDWLDGVAYGPWTWMSWEEMRERTPARFPIRRYPDITHTVRCQYPVREWDPAFAHTVGREPVYSTPRAQAHIYKRYLGVSDGFGVYSDGVHDDLHKALWSAYGWDPDTDLDTFLTDYGKTFFGEAVAADVAKGLLMLEDNWAGPILDNTTIPKTLAMWQSIAERCGDHIDSNWRLQMFLLRANYDAYVQNKAAVEAASEAEVLEILRKANNANLDTLVEQAKAVLAEASDDASYRELRARIEALGLDLLDSIGYQLSVKPPYYAKNPERGAMLDWLDQPLSNWPWIAAMLDHVSAMDTRDMQVAWVQQIANWEDPGEGGFYDDLGHVGRQPHVVYQMSWEEDPGGVHTPRVEFMNYKGDEAKTPQRISWTCQAQTLYGTPLQMRYENLDPAAQYVLRVTYAGRFRATMTLTTDDAYRIHEAMPQPAKPWPVEFHIPRGATADGTLELEWDLVSGRGCQVAEVWLIKQ